VTSRRRDRAASPAADRRQRQIERPQIRGELLKLGVQIYDVWFRPILAFFIIELGSRRVVPVGVTHNPTAMWTAQQLREATPFGRGPRFIIRDNVIILGERHLHRVLEKSTALGTTTRRVRTRRWRS